MLTLKKHAHWLKQIRKNEEEEEEEENSFSESDDARFRHPSNDIGKKRKIGVAIRPKRMKEEVKA